ncbi:MAG: hypothetical protein K0B15_15460 [Lentimicrobium sp.]|nr:hypothetical protein [Lentimicrobium sp.]
MNKLILISFFLFASFYVLSQEDKENDLHWMKQKVGSELNVIDFFQKSNLSTENINYLYAIVFNPMSCPRCEGAINPFIRELRKVDSTSIVCLIIENSKTNAVKSYLTKRKFEAPYIIIDTEEKFTKNFEFSTKEIQVPFITKFDLEKGVLIISKSTLGINLNADFVERIHSQTNPQMQVTESSNSYDYNNLSSSTMNLLKPLSKCLLNENTQHPISHISYPNLSKSGKIFCFKDELTQAIFAYEIKDTIATLINVLEPTEDEKKLFISPEIGDTLYTMLNKMNILNCMYFNCSLLSDDSVIISASLPKVFWEDKLNEHLAYYNEIVYLIKDLNNNTIRYFTLDTAFSDITLSHTSTSFDLYNNSLYIPISRGWPYGDKELLDPNDTISNPFNSKFYNSSPLMAKFDFQGNFISFIGKLDSTFALNKVGYTYINLTVKSFDSTIFYTTGYSGDLYWFLNNQNYTNSIKLFTPLKYTPNSSYDKQPLKYLQECQNIYNKNIIDFICHEKYIYTVVKQHELYKIFVTDGLSIIKEFDLPNLINKDKFVTYILKINDETVICYGVFESPENSGLYKFVVN